MASPSVLISISEVNSLNDEQFESVFGNVVELCKDAAVQVKKNRPFQSLTALCNAFQTYLEELRLEGKVSPSIRIMLPSYMNNFIPIDD